MRAVKEKLSGRRRGQLTLAGVDRRHWAAGGAVALHAAAAALISVSWTVAHPSPGTVVASIDLVRIDNPDQLQPDAAVPTFDLQPVRHEIVPPEVEVSELVEGSEPGEVGQPPAPALATQAGMSGACDTLGRVSRVLLADASITGMVDAAPAGTRSVSDAIILWNQEWTAVTHLSSGALSRVRRIIQTTLADVAPPCLGSEVLGPRLVLLPSPRGTVVLVFGSGSWSWGSLIEGSLIESSGLLEDVVRKPQPEIFAKPETDDTSAAYPSRQQADQRGRIDTQRLEIVDTTGEQP